MRPYVFVSYAHEDEKFAGDLVAALRKRGIKVWRDRDNLRFAQNYVKTIGQAVKKSALVIWIASRASIESDFVRHEISAAEAGKRRIGLVLLDEFDLKDLRPPFNLSVAPNQTSEFFNGDFDENADKLARDIHALLRPIQAFRLALCVCLLLVCAGGGMLAWRVGKPSGSIGAGNDSSHPPGAQTGTASDREQPGAVADPPLFSESLSDAVLALPAGEVLRIAYTGVPPSRTEEMSEPQLRLQILARRQEKDGFAALENGDALVSGTDHYLIVAQALTQGYLYIFQVDSMGRKEWLFPENETSEFSGGKNPVKPDDLIWIPADPATALYLDENTGFEHIYAVFSATPWKELEDALAKPPGSFHPSPEAVASRGVEQPLALADRGIGGIRRDDHRPETSVQPVSAETQGGLRPEKVEFTHSPFAAQEGFMVIERWFRHLSP